jgi:hypothetical protein
MASTQAFQVANRRPVTPAADMSPHQVFAAVGHNPPPALQKRLGLKARHAAPRTIANGAPGPPNRRAQEHRMGLTAISPPLRLASLLAVGARLKRALPMVKGGCMCRTSLA